MAPDSDDRQSQQDAVTDREPLVDINPEPTGSCETGIQLKPRRKRLSDTQGQTDELQPEPKPQRRCLSDVAQADAEEPATERPSPGGRPRLSFTRSQLAVTDMQEEAGTVPIYDGAPAGVQPGETAPAQSPMTPAAIEQRIAELRARQNLPLAAASGLLAALVGAMLWAVITVTTNYQIGWMAVGVGFLVASVIRVLGRGLDKSFGYLGAALALVGCLLGNHLTSCMFIARETGLSATAVLTRIDPVAVLRLMIATFHPLDVLFYGLAVYEGYRFSFRRIAAVDTTPSKS
ncbi:MAG: hypothetical protein ABFD90_08560 [Phycisphaerales bacterium]